MSHYGCNSYGGSPSHSDPGPDDEDIKEQMRERENSSVIEETPDKEFPWFWVSMAAILILSLLTLLFTCSPKWIDFLFQHPAITS